MDLHNAIMNIRVDEQNLFYKYGNESLYAYKEGHRDARHSAAELSLKADARIEELESLIQGTIDCVSVYGDVYDLSTFIIENLEKAFKK